MKEQGEVEMSGSDGDKTQGVQTGDQNGDIEILDTSGLICPEPVMLLHKKIRVLAHGQRLKIIATDPSTERDIPKFCNFLGHPLIFQGREGDNYLFELEKGES